MKLFSFSIITLLFVHSLLSDEFKGKWVLNTKYLKGDIVVYIDNSYIAIQDVPSSVGGTPDTLAEYWFDFASDPNKPTSPVEGAPNFIPPTTDIPSNAPADRNSSEPTSFSWLSGISTRGPISLNNAMTGGILIEGNEDKKVVFMAKGYSMFVSDNVENYAEDLEMVIYSWNDSDEKWEYQGEYDDWVDVTNSTTESGSIVENISTIETSKNPEITLLQDEKEAGVVLTLPPGYHAAIVSSKSSSLQEGIVEAYEVK